MLGRVGHWLVIWLWRWSSPTLVFARRLPVAGVVCAGVCGSLAGYLAVALVITDFGVCKAIAGGWRGRCWGVWVTGL
ncbi:hypothetical protein EHS17_14420 [Rhodobacteraceae bacterium CH30]|nr:hypothetical protein EHS17_14420 [Rhodobacteraceae bacterium CH30]